MRHLPFLLLAFAAANGVAATDRVVPVITGTIGDRTYRTTVDLRSSSMEQCSFELRASNGASFRSVEPVEAGKPKLLDEFASELGVFASTVRVSCSGAVEVHSRIHESRDGAATYADGPLFVAAIPQPLTAGESYVTSIGGDFIVAEIEGAPAHVAVTLTATATNRVAERQYELASFGVRSVGMNGVLRSVGPINAQFVVTGEGSVVVFQEVTAPAMAQRARRAPDEVRARLNAQVAASSVPSTQTAPSITQQLLISPFEAAPFRDPATGLVFMRDRWYDPSTGTFLTPDRAGYRDSSNLYIYGGGDPVNNSDSTGMYIDETPILNSPLRNRYIAWRDDFRSSQLGREAWDRIHALPASRFTLTMEPLTGARVDDTGAIASRQYDAGGNMIGASISFGPKFGTTPPDANDPRNLVMYPRAFDVERSVIFSRRRYRAYSFGHEFGHILSGFDPATSSDARLFSTLSRQHDTVSQQILALYNKQRAAGLTPHEQATLAQLLVQQQQIEASVNPLKVRSEQYGDAIGYQFFRSWNLQHHRILERPNPNPPPSLPPGALPPP